MVSTNTSQKRQKKLPTENVDLVLSTGKLVAKAKPRRKLVVNSSSNSGRIHERKWIDGDTQQLDHSCFEMSKFMTRTLRHEASIPREIDGAVKFDDFTEKLKVEFADTLQCTYSQYLGEFSGKRRRKEEHVSILLESLFIQ